ncbi:MAG TPA: aldolase/citrate lyase family protein [Chloroflexota bacterium]|jgi:4-hydroxy-2-oxoheptanedioate aldolase|nr:aldolase/citrate lyase family protein [Chloroflexota bacterium]
MAKRVNRVIELLEEGQPVYYTGPSDRSYEGGKTDAGTWADYITYDFEHSPFDITTLRAYMRGLVDGGPTRSGHRTPTVVVTLPVTGTSEMAIRANSWQIAHVLSAGVHGILLCHAEDPAAVRAFVESTRYPFQTQGVGDGGLGVGRMGNGGQGYAAQIWGLPVPEYMKKADPWPLNPEGELFLGLKVENKRALANAEESLKVPGIAFAEWGPGDMGLSLGFMDRHDPPYPPEMQEARARVLAACKANNVAFLNQVRPNDVAEMIAEGVKIGASRQEAAEIGRRHTERTMPW